MIDYLRRKVHNLTHPVLGRILMLHRVVEQRSDKPEQRELEVTPAFLEQTIIDSQKKGYSFTSIEELLNTKHLTLNTKKRICLTFDDGYLDTYTTAYPLLKRLNIPFAVYVTTGFVDKTAQMWWYPTTDAMTWEQIKALDNDPLCTIGAHTVSHPRLDTLSEEMQRKEIVEGKQQLESILGHPVHHFSYPHGAYNANTIDIVKSTSFRSALMAWGGTVRRGDNTLLLHRMELRQPSE